MSFTSMKERSVLETTEAQTQLQTAEQEARQREAGIQAGERFLGTEAQIAGTGGFDPRMAAYTKRFSYDPAAIAQVAGPKGRWVKGQDTKAFFRGLDPGQRHAARKMGAGGWAQQAIDQANALAGQAEEAARAGDWEQAASLREQAESAWKTAMPSGGPLGSVWQSALKEEFATPEAEAEAQLAAPGAQVVGKLVRSAEQLMTPGSQEREAFLGGLTEAPLRALSGAERFAEVRARDVAANLGAGRSPGAMAAVQARTAERFAAQRAQVLSSARQWFEGFSREFAANTADFAQKWLQNQGGFRDQFGATMQSIFGARAQIATSAADLYRQWGQMEMEKQQFSQERSDAWISTGIGAGMTLLGAAGGFMVGGPAGAMLGAQVGSMAGGATSGAQGEAQ